MVYIARDGTVHQSAPWSVQRFIGLITGFFNFIIMFFKTMLDMKDTSTEPSYSGNNRRGGGGGGPPPPPRGPRQRPIGRMMTLRDCTIPGGG